MDEELKKERFETFKIKTSVARKFRRFSRSIGQSQSMTLLLMLEFFELNQLSPKEHIGPKMQTLANLIKKRNNAIIAIMRDIEKNQTKPTVAMMHALFEGEGETDKKPILTERKNTDKTLEAELENWKNKTGLSHDDEL